MSITVTFSENQKSNALLEQIHTSVSCQDRYRKASEAKEIGTDLNIKIYNISAHVKNRTVMSTCSLFSVVFFKTQLVASFYHYYTQTYYKFSRYASNNVTVEHY
jgi:Na+/melibiose symporter-like transporter